MAAALAQLLSSLTSFLIHLACWLLSTIQLGWVDTLVFHMLIGIYGRRMEVEVGEKTTQQPSFLAHLSLLPVLHEVTIPAILSPQILCDRVWLLLWVSMDYICNRNITDFSPSFVSYSG